MDFIEAIKVMKEGKKVRSNYMTSVGYYLHIKNKRIYHHVGFDEEKIADGNSLNAWILEDQTDSNKRVWSVVDENKDFCLKRKRIGNPDFKGEAFDYKDAKTCKEVLIERLGKCVQGTGTNMVEFVFYGDVEEVINETFGDL